MLRYEQNISHLSSWTRISSLLHLRCSCCLALFNNMFKNKFLGPFKKPSKFPEPFSLPCAIWLTVLHGKVDIPVLKPRKQSTWRRLWTSWDVSDFVKERMKLRSSFLLRRCYNLMRMAFQIGRSSEEQIDFTIVDTWLASGSQLASSSGTNELSASILSYFSVFLFLRKSWCG